MKYRKEIDGLRALALVPVILFHAGFAAFEGGYVGVDVFFVLSGYLITSVVVVGLQAQTFSLPAFYERRARRILPALFLVVIVCIPIACIMLTPSNLKEFSQSVLASSTLTSNILFWLKTGYFDSKAEFKPLLHTWSLSVEWQYYLLFPVFLCALWRLEKLGTTRSLIVAFLVCITLAQWGTVAYPEFTFYMLPTRAWELLMGSVVALYRIDRWQTFSVPSTLCQAGGLTGLLLITISVFTFDRHTPMPGLHALTPCLGAALIILCANDRTVAGKLLGNRLLVGLGAISYSAYLWHWPIFVFTRHGSSGKLELFSTIAATGLTLVIACLSWKFVERPFRDRQIVSRTLLWRTALTSIILCCAFGLVGHYSKGFWDIKADETQKRMLLSVKLSDMRDDCHTGGANFKKPAKACTYFLQDSSWAVMGDSHTVELAYALASALKEHNTGITHYSFSGCAPMYRRANQDGCSRWTHEVVSRITDNPSIRHIVVSYRVNAYLFGDHLKSYPDTTDQVQYAERSLRWLSYVGLLEALKNSGKNVILVLQAPELAMRLEDLVYGFDGSSGEIMGVDRAWWNRRNAFVISRIAELEKYAIVVDPANLLCDAYRCYATRHGKALYFDDNHMSIEGARIVSAEILRRVSIAPRSPPPHN